jgi:hypothetical protein
MHCKSLLTLIALGMMSPSFASAGPYDDDAALLARKQSQRSGIVSGLGITHAGNAITIHDGVALHQGKYVAIFEKGRGQAILVTRQAQGDILNLPNHQMGSVTFTLPRPAGPRPADGKITYWMHVSRTQQDETEIKLDLNEPNSEQGVVTGQAEYLWDNNNGFNLQKVTANGRTLTSLATGAVVVRQSALTDGKILEQEAAILSSASDGAVELTIHPNANLRIKRPNDADPLKIVFENADLSLPK